MYKTILRPHLTTAEPSGGIARAVNLMPPQVAYGVRHEACSIAYGHRGFITSTTSLRYLWVTDPRENSKNLLISYVCLSRKSWDRLSCRSKIFVQHIASCSLFLVELLFSGWVCTELVVHSCSMVYVKDKLGRFKPLRVEERLRNWIF